ncbi:hypothetical protein L6452_15124 [Arctium lappa]|uniref:Uncharacterized protein n=1 Tax=Arctium lappa TaxID=4217 RepID=A0ACB9CMX4_ARCLA|nr:hypothetical protein L6452_15124 [Arctium lappa]
MNIFASSSFPPTETECYSIDFVDECTQEYTSSILQEDLFTRYFSISSEDDLDLVDLHEVQASLAEPLVPNQPPWSHKVEPLPSLAHEPSKNQILEKLAGQKFYYFLDGYSGYNQVAIHPDDQEKTTFTCNVHLTSTDAEKDVRSFLGHTGFYRRFIKDFSAISRHLCNLLAKDNSFVFNKACLEAFETIKQKLVEAPIMQKPDWSLPFELMCDASTEAMGFVLGQRVNKNPVAIYYACRTFSEAQMHYMTTEKELLVVVFALENFRSYLERR